MDKTEPELALKTKKRLYPLGTRYIDSAGRPWIYLREVKSTTKVGLMNIATGMVVSKLIATGLKE